mgnify:CR=1 FL=1
MWCYIPRMKIPVTFRIDSALTERLEAYCIRQPYTVTRTAILEAALKRWLDEDDAKRQRGAREKDQRR